MGSETFPYSKSDNIRIVVRCRPLEKQGKGKKIGLRNAVRDSTNLRKDIIEVASSSSLLVRSDRGDDGRKHKKFRFDHVFNGGSQEQIFEQTGKEAIENALSGFNSAIFALGQMASGKTYTMQGIMGENVDLEQHAVQEARGLIQRVCQELFESTRRSRKQDGYEYTVWCSYLQIYRENVSDLLNPPEESSGLEVRENTMHGESEISVVNLRWVNVKSARDCFNALKSGLRNRKIGETVMNEVSSRSHAIFTLKISQRSKCYSSERQARIHLVDLAGSERQTSTKSSGLRLREAGKINSSLSVLGNVISALVDIRHGKTRHVPYRDSKLTFLLKDSLGGNSRTCMIATISKDPKNFTESMSTLQFAQRCKLVKNRPVLNESLSAAPEDLHAQIRELKTQIAQITIERENDFHAGDVNSKCKRCSHVDTDLQTFDIEANNGSPKLRNAHSAKDRDIERTRDFRYSKRNETNTQNLNLFQQKVERLEYILAESISKELNCNRKASSLFERIDELNMLVKRQKSILEAVRFESNLKEQKITILSSCLKMNQLLNSDSEASMLKEEIALLKEQRDNYTELCAFGSMLNRSGTTNSGKFIENGDQSLSYISFEAPEVKKEERMALIRQLHSSLVENGILREELRMERSYEMLPQFSNSFAAYRDGTAASNKDNLERFCKRSIHEGNCSHSQEPTVLKTSENYEGDDFPTSQVPRFKTVLRSLGSSIGELKKAMERGVLH